MYCPRHRGWGLGQGIIRQIAFLALATWLGLGAGEVVTLNNPIRASAEQRGTGVWGRAGTMRRAGWALKGGLCEKRTLMLRGGNHDEERMGCYNVLLSCVLACVISPKRWGKDNEDMKGNGRDELMWAEVDDDEGFDAMAESLHKRIGNLPLPTLEHETIKKRRQLGTGGFAAVFEAEITPKKGGGEPVTCACKVFSFIAGMGERQTNFFKNWLHELKVLEYLATRPECGVVDFYGFSLHHETSDAKITVQICMELMRGGSLRDNLLVLKRKGLSIALPVAFSIIRQVAMALQGLHAPVHDVYGTGKRVSIVHRDMKPENILISAKLTGGISDTVVCKLGDVGLAALRTVPGNRQKKYETTKVGKAGTYPYIAPETLLQGRCSSASDIFSLGLLMWELVEGETPFHDVPNLDGMLPIFWQDNRRPPLDTDKMMAVPLQLRTLIEKCWHPDKRKRPTAEQVVQILDALEPQIFSPFGTGKGSKLSVSATRSRSGSGEQRGRSKGLGLLRKLLPFRKKEG